ncbi:MULTISPECIES: phage head closure protein [unclassified Acinetobacter]|uniref:phage head closure protein n=1 Tax=unclassified Acinetobacter TaxID=196816 RepID=UPI0025C5E5BA|nr:MULTISPECIES: phage head closure protein [unclassified Acinetobacter]
MADLAPELCHRITIQHYVAGGRDEDGFEIEGSWQEYQQLWAKVTPLSARDLISAQADQSEVVARMKIRYREDINTTMQVIWKGRTFSIQSQALDDNETGNIYCTFLLGQGLEKPK